MITYGVYRDGWGTLGAKERPGALGKHLRAVAADYEERHGVRLARVIVHKELVAEALGVAPVGVKVGGSGGCLWGEVWVVVGGGASRCQT